uniref:Uncharacterized protein n=1 Tax=Timema monikensis TaxID=170555 RepID=A0A7R9HN54_9NEOP|nr:unnamed protein product [Timema monikensis]
MRLMIEQMCGSSSELPENPRFVLDGCNLLHGVPWLRPASYGIEKEYEQKVIPDGKISIDGFLCVFDVSVVPDSAQRLFRRHVKKLKDEHLAKRIQSFMDILPDILHEMVPELSNLRDRILKYLKNILLAGAEIDPTAETVVTGSFVEPTVSQTELGALGIEPGSSGSEASKSDHYTTEVVGDLISVPARDNIAMIPTRFQQAQNQEPMACERPTRMDMSPKPE